MVRIEIAALRKGLNNMVLTPEVGSLELDPEMFSDIVVEAEVDVQPGQVLVRFVASGDAHLTCDRTLKPFIDRVVGSHAVLFSTEVVAEDTEDARPLSAADQYVDISDAVRDTLVLALPSRRVAPGADSVEIPNSFGVGGDDEVDPRWDALRGLPR